MIELPDFGLTDLLEEVRIKGHTVTERVVGNYTLLQVSYPPSPSRSGRGPLYFHITAVLSDGKVVGRRNIVTGDGVYSINADIFGENVVGYTFSPYEKSLYGITIETGIVPVEAFLNFALSQNHATRFTDVSVARFSSPREVSGLYQRSESGNFVLYGLSLYQDRPTPPDVRLWFCDVKGTPTRGFRTYLPRILLSQEPIEHRAF